MPTGWTNAHLAGVAHMTAGLPKGTNLKIVLKGDNIWAVSDNFSTLTVNWLVSPYNTTTKSQEFEVKESGKPNDLYLAFFTSNVFTNITVEYYENNAVAPTRVKSLVVGSALQYKYPLNGTYGPNILNDSITKVVSDLTNSMRAEVSSGGALKVIVNGGGT